MNQAQVTQICVSAITAATANKPALFFKHFKAVAAAYGWTGGYQARDRAAAQLNTLLVAAKVHAHPQFWQALHGYLANHDGFDYNGGLADLLGGAIVMQGLLGNKVIFTKG